MRASPFLERVKPLLAWITTIDFGRVTYADDFMWHLQQANLTVKMEEVISVSGGRTAKMVVAERS